MSFIESEKVKSHVGIKIYYPNGLNTNGTAIEGVCVTGEAIRHDVPVVSKERVPVASRYGAVFAPSRAAGFAIAVYDESL
jgi:hypothetical protein